MSLLLHAITPAGVAPPEGFAAFLGRRVAVVYADREAPSPDRAAVLEFGRTIQELADDGPLLPIRFGTTVADLERLAELVAEHEPAWSARLSAVSGCCELIVHVNRESPAAPSSGQHISGREYLLQRTAAVRAADALQDQVGAALRPVAKEIRSLPGGKDHHRFALLVHRATATVARTDVQRWATAHPDLHVAVTGPWPPFSFGEEVA
jgi:hypothetical protein